MLEAVVSEENLPVQLDPSQLRIIIPFLVAFRHALVALLPLPSLSVPTS